jgi:hypothetical protein
VNFSANLEQRLRVTQTPTAGGGAAWGSHRRGASYGVWGGYRTDVRGHHVLLGVVSSRRRRQLVWEGVRSADALLHGTIGRRGLAVRDIFRSSRASEVISCTASRVSP